MTSLVVSIAHLVCNLFSVPIQRVELVLQVHPSLQVLVEEGDLQKLVVVVVEFQDHQGKGEVVVAYQNHQEEEVEGELLAEVVVEEYQKHREVVAVEEEQPHQKPVEMVVAVEVHPIRVEPEGVLPWKEGEEVVVGEVLQILLAGEVVVVGEEEWDPILGLEEELVQQ